MTFKEALYKAFPKAKKGLLDPLVTYNDMQPNKLRLAHFFAQLAHESDGFKTLEEYASGKAYEGRKDLGNTEPGDGVKYKGRGYIQITGRSNYRFAGQALNLGLLDNPKLLLTPVNGFNASLWYWRMKRLDDYADRNDIIRITKAINGGLTHLEERKKMLTVFKTIFNIN